MDYFRAMLSADEMSERAFELTTEVLRYNSANYTVWVFRRKLLVALEKNLNAELNFVREFALTNPKNYQIWHHRREIVSLLGDGSKEKGFTSMALKDDAKNYHAWSHRQWVLERFNLWDGELEFIQSLLEQDSRNNSAWNQRWFVVHRANTPLDVGIEIEFCLTYIRRIPDNESPWNYLRGLFRTNEYAAYPAVEKECLILIEQTPENTFPHACLADIYEQQQRSEECRQVLNKLATQLDVVRHSYWDYRSRIAFD